MIEYAGHEFMLNARQKDGATLRDHLEKQAANGRLLGKEPPELLEPVEMPSCLLYLWRWFTDLSNGRQYGEAGPMALSYSEILAWANLTHSEPTAWEVGVLKEIDRAYLVEAMKK